MGQRNPVLNIPVHAVVDAGVDEAVPAVDVLAQLRQPQVEAAGAVAHEAAEELDDLDALVADHLAALGIPEHGHGGPALEPAAPQGVHLSELPLAVEPVGAAGREGPRAVVPGDGYGDREAGLKTEKRATTRVRCAQGQGRPT